MLEGDAERFIEEYINEVAKLGVVQSVVLGCDDRRGYLFNVFTCQLKVEDFSDPHFSPELTMLGGKLSRNFSNIGLNLNVLCVQPSRLETFKEASRLKGIALIGGIAMDGKGFEI